MNLNNFKTQKFWSGVILFNPSTKEVLLNHRDKLTQVNPDMWSFFGGGNEPGETPEMCAIREVKEEISVTLSRSDLKPFRNYLNHRQTGWHYIFCADLTLPKSAMKLNEGVDFEWVDVHKAMEYNLTHSTRNDLAYFIQKLQ